MIDFYHYFVGDWALSTPDQKENGTLSIRVAGCGAAHLVEYDFAGLKRTELWGYDPASKLWCATGIDQRGERFRQEMHGAPTEGKATAGVSWTSTHRGILPSGEATSAELRFEIESPDAYLVSVTEAKQGKLSLPDVKMQCVRVSA